MSELVPLGELATIVSGATPKTDVKEYWNGDIPWITPADLTDWHAPYFKGQVRRITEAGLKNCSARLLPEGAILFSSRAPIGHCAIVTTPLCTNQGFKSLIPNHRLHSLYGYYALRHFTPDIVAMGRGATFAEITKEIMEDVQIPLPSPDEQRRIAALLERADHLRRTRRFARQMSDTFLQSVFLQMFGDPATNPNGFEKIRLNELFATDRDGTKCGPFGGALKKEEFVQNGIPAWVMDNIQDNRFAEKGCLFISPEKFKELSGYSVQNGDIIVSRAGTVGKMCVVETTAPQSIISTNLIRLSLNTSKILPIFFTTLMIHFGAKIGKIKAGQEGAYTFMNTGVLANLEIPLPPIEKQHDFAAIVQRFERLRAGQIEAERQAEHLFQTLLHQAFAAENQSATL